MTLVGRGSESPPSSPARDGARRHSQGQSLARATTEMETVLPAAVVEMNNNNNINNNDDDGVVVHEEVRESSVIMTLGLDTKHPAEIGPPPKFGEFLRTCGWCNNYIGDGNTAYMFGNFNAFCNPKCQAKVVKLLYEVHLAESGLPEHHGMGC